MMGILASSRKVALLSESLIFLPTKDRALENEPGSEEESRKPRFSVTKHR